jgi:eukaryotic-like serine/threonine-protein kinase
LIGKTLSHFEITAKLGEGGMGAVYRATDSKLGREVAIKVLPEAFTRQPERLARFEREAKVLASLNHPNIAAIYEVGEATAEDSESVHFLAMELVEGEDVSERLRRGPIAVEEALGLAIQIAEALETAHERGIVHRDLKPANVRLTPGGKAKVLDFGLAKASESAAGGAELSHSPTLTAQMTQIGTLLGTAAYMSPEQARGVEADRRSDVWAFGLLFSEMLSGRRTFDENTVSDTLAAVLKSEPDLSGLPPGLPAAASRLISRCLRKDPKERLRDMGDVGLELREIRARLGEPEEGVEVGGDVAPASSARRTLVPAILAGVAVALGVWALLPSRAAGPVSQAGLIRFGISAPEATTFIRGLAVSPDGSKVAVTVRNPQGRSEIWVRSLDALVARRVPGTESGARFPFWSPDSRQLGYFADYELKVVALDGTPPRTLVSGLTQAPDTRGGAWGAGGTIVYAPSYSGGLMQISADGGKAEAATRLDAESGNGTHRFPTFLPDGRHFIFYASSGTGLEPGQLRLGELGSTETRPLTSSSSFGVLAPPDRLLFTIGEVLVIQRLDMRTLEMVGSPQPLGIELPGGLAISGLRSIGVSERGTLAYLVDNQAWNRLEWVDRKGAVVSAIEDPNTWHYAPRISPDGSTVAVARYATDTDGGDIWLFDRQRGLGRPFLAGPDSEDLVAWSPDGRRLAFTLTRANDLQLYLSDLDGHRTLLTESGGPLYTNSWTRDGLGLIVEEEAPGGGLDLEVLSIAQPAAPRKTLLATRYAEWDGEQSPDGRWMAYVSDVTGRREVYVRPFDGSQSPWQVSTQGGSAPCWSRDGSELFFVSTDDWMQAAAVTATDRFSTRPPERLFEARVENEPIDRQYDVGPDGVFLVSRRSDDATEPVMVVVGLDQLLSSSAQPAP